MAVTPVGNPYVESSDLVANYPGASEALAERIDIVGVNPFANAAARDAAIPSPVQGQMCSLNDDNKGYRYDGSAWLVFSGAGPANFTNTATGTYTEDGIDFKYLTLTGSTSVDIDQAGFADILVIGGGGGGGAFRAGGGGAGGHLYATNVYLSAATHTVTIGAGGAGGSTAVQRVPQSGNNGIASSIGNSIYSPGGGGGADISYQYTPDSGQYAGMGLNGSSGGGGSNASGAGGAGISGLGNAGGTGTVNSTGGGGGSGAVGSNGTNNVGGAGGAGTANSITNSSVTRAGGGGGAAITGGAGGTGGGGAGGSSANGTNASANTGSGGGGGFKTTVTQSGGNGGSGLVIIRVVV